eukprot:g24048.t1
MRRIQWSGTVRYFSGGEEVRREVLNTVTGGQWQPGTGSRTTLGTNIYDKEGERRPPSGPLGETQAAPSAAGKVPAPPAPPPSPAETAKTQAAVGELNMLASLIGGEKASVRRAAESVVVWRCAVIRAPQVRHPAQSTETFKLENLFGHDIFTKEGPGSSGAQVIQIDGAAGGEHRVALESIRDEFEVPPPPPPPEDDLLDLMDNA